MTTCDEVQLLMNDRMDGLLDPGSARKLDLHIAGCGPCREEFAMLARVLEEAHELPAGIEPGRDLWPDIRARIELAPAVVPFAPRAGHLLRNVFALAAMAAMVFGLLTLRQVPPAIVPPVAELTEMQKIEADYRKAKDELLAVLREQQDGLPPDTLAAVEESLGVIESAVHDLQTALNTAPGDSRLERMLAATYRNEVSLLEQTVRLASQADALRR